MNETRLIRTINLKATINSKCITTKRAAEYDILKEVLSCCRGLESDIIKFEEPGYTVPKDVFFENSQVINQILELAYLYRSAKNLINKQQNCMVAEALREVIQMHIADYELKIANMWSSKGNGQDSKFGTFKKALPWARESMIILQFLVIILSLTQNLHGGLILNPILKYENHGNKKLSAVFKTLLYGASKPLLEMIKCWIFKGIIYDPKDEFFIYENNDTFARTNWNSQFVVRTELVPNKFNLLQATLILETGKCVYFLKKFWTLDQENKEIIKYKKEMLDLKNKFEITLNKEFHSSKPGENSLISEIRKIHLMNTKYVLKVLKKDYHLLNFFKNLHQYILMSQGDFARRFMEAMQQYSSHRNETFDFSLDPMLRNILYKMADGHKKSDWNNIHININSTQTSDETIFEAFSLKYSMKGPLKMIFQSYEKDYHLLFIFLWRKSYMQYKLVSITRDLFSLKKYDDDDSSGFYIIIRELYFLKYQMTNFMFHLEYYIVHEVIEKEWYHFMNAFNMCESVEEVIKAHERMLSRIFMGTLMDNHHKNLNVQIKVIFDLIEEFQKVTNTILIYESKIKIIDTIIYKFGAKISVLSSNFMKSVKSFKHLLKMCHHIDSLSAVYDRIDFNKFYSNIG